MTSKLAAKFGDESLSLVALSIEAYNLGFTCFTSGGYFEKGQIYKKITS
jgi:hypothetical protein